MTRSRTLVFVLALLAWALVATLVAWRRIPFDDEWFSLGLATYADSAHVNRALAADLHPPWTALLDRAVFRWTSSVGALHLLRVAASMFAVALYARTLLRAAKLPLLAVVLAAFHPIVLFYAGAARWYPYVFLAQGLRAWALWGTKEPRHASMAFVAGSIIGPAASYLELLFVLLDSIWMLVSRGRDMRVAVALGASLALALTLASPVGPLHGVELGIALGRHALSAPSNAAAWLSLGLVGEAHPPWPWLLAGAVVPLAVVMAWKAMPSVSRAFGGWLLSHATLWLLCTVVGVSHPRHSLAMWLIAAAPLAMGWRAGGFTRALVTGAGAYLAVVLALTVSGRNFLKLDLNRLPPEACAALPGSDDLIIVPYERAAEQIRATCARELITFPVLRFYLDERPEVASVLEGRERVTLVAYLRATGTQARVQAALLDVLRAKCEREEQVFVNEVPHHALKATLMPDLPRHQFSVERWRCR